MKGHKILVVDDEKDIVSLLEYNFEQAGYCVKSAKNGQKALEVAKEFRPAVVILDLMMPKLDGIETCRLLRKFLHSKQTYILLLTARGEEYSEVAAFEAGADDYLVKPVKIRALLSRVASVLKRSETVESEESKEVLVEVGDLVIDKNKYSISCAGEVISLRRKEFDLLHFMATRQGRIFSRETLLDKVWGGDRFVSLRTVDVHIRRIREKIGKRYIHTQSGVGYFFDVQGS